MAAEVPLFLLRASSRRSFAAFFSPALRGATALRGVCRRRLR